MAGRVGTSILGRFKRRCKQRERGMRLNLGHEVLQWK